MTPVTVTPMAMAPMTIMPPAGVLHEIGVGSSRGLHGSCHIANRCRLGAGRHQAESKRESYC
jgi:hypothetical protein